MFVTIRENFNKTSVTIPTANRLLPNKTFISRKLFTSFALITLLSLHSTIVFSDNSEDIYPVDNIGTIQRNSSDYETDNTVRDRTINGIRYEMLEVRDELNDIIMHPDDYKKEIVVETKEEHIIPAKPASQKKEIVVEKHKPETKPAKTKPMVKQVATKKLKLLPVKETTNNNVGVKSTATNTTKPVYLKLSNDGDVLAQQAEQWSCVQDTNSGLMWEVKASDNSLRDANNLYSWLAEDKKNTNGFINGGRCQGGIACDTKAYIQAMNEKNFCGHNDWQLPTKEQLQTLVYLKNNHESVKINKMYFPETVPSWYWTASENNDNKNFAWYVLFRNGVALSDLKERPKHIRLVRKSSQQVATYE